MTNQNHYEPAPDHGYTTPPEPQQPVPVAESSAAPSAPQYAPPAQYQTPAPAEAIHQAPTSNSPQYGGAGQYSPPAQQPGLQNPAAASAPQFGASTQGQAPQPQYATGQGNYAPVGVAASEVNKLALASLVASSVAALCSLLLFAGVQFGILGLFVLPAAGAILGHFALRDIKREGGKGGTGRGLALAGIISGWTLLAAQLMVAVLVAVFAFLLGVAFM